MSPEPYPSLGRTLGLLAVTLLLGALLGAVFWVLFPDWPRIAQMAVPTDLALAGAIVYGVHRTGLPWSRALAIRPLPARHLAPLLFVMVGSVTVFSELYVVIQWIVPVPPVYEAMLRDLLSMDGPLDVALTLLVAVVLAPVLEEALFRGLILNGLARRYGPWIACVWTAAFFALFHFYNPWQILPTFFLGLVLAWVVLATRTLLSAIVLHAAFNGMSLALFDLPLDSADPSAATLPWVVAGIVALLLLGSAALLWGLAWLERETEGGWFTQGERADDAPHPRSADAPVQSRPGPSTARW